MNSFYVKTKNIYRNDGIGVLAKRLLKYSVVKLKRVAIKSEFDRWAGLKDKYSGKRIFILGNGPSLNQSQLYFLKDEYTMCFNRVNLMLERLNWSPNFYVMTDDLLIKDMHKEVIKEIIPKVDFAFFPDLHPSNVNFKKRIGNHNNVYYLNTDIPEFRTDLPKCGINKTVVNAGMQIAAYLGFKEIYLLGVDMSFRDQKVKKTNSREWTADKDDDPNHFDPRYFGKGRSFHNPTVHEMMEQFDKGRIFFDNLGVKIYNAGKGGKLEAFKRVKFDSLFNYSNKKQEQLFMSLIYPNGTYSSFEDLKKSLPLIESTKDYNDTLPSFIIDAKSAAKFINIAVFTHVPFGPFENHYIFKKREK